MFGRQTVGCDVIILSGNGLFLDSNDGMDCYIVKNKYACDSDSELEVRFIK